MKLTPKSMLVLTATGLLNLTVVSTAAVNAQEQNGACSFPNDTYDFEQGQVDRLYDCLEESLADGYGKEGHEIGANFLDWNLTQSGIGPAVAGHGDRFV